VPWLVVRDTDLSVAVPILFSHAQAASLIAWAAAHLIAALPGCWGRGVKLFGYLPETLFQPLAGPKKHVYARLLLHLYDRVFAARVLETPTREEVLKHLAVALSDVGVHSSEELREDADETGDNPQAHYLAYYRLRNTGWLTEEQDKWNTLVEMDPDAFMVIGSISDLANNRVRVAGAVVEVKSSLESAAADPKTMAQGLANAHDAAVRFARNMRRILVGMREIEDAILGNPDAVSILRTFFRDFVDGLLIADYKQLKTSDNPYRYRRQISALASELLNDPEKRLVIAQTYVDQGVLPAGTAIPIAEERVVSELEKVRRVFEDVGNFMEKIEEFRDRLERRVRTTVHYMDLIGEGSAERLARLIEKVAGLGGAEVECVMRTPDVGFPITALALYTPPPPRIAPAPTRVKIPKPDPFLRAYITAGTEFDRMVRVTPEKLLAFVERKMADRTSLPSSEIEIETLEDLFAFRHLPSLAGRSQVGEYRIVLEAGRTDNDWINLGAFRIERDNPEQVPQC
jgi:hypothetical protein